MRVKEIMTKAAAFCRPGDNLAAVVAEMWDARCGALPVLDEHGFVTSMITDRDICIALGTRNRLASEIRVSDVSLPRVFTCAVEDDVRTALLTMTSQNVRRLPVVESDRKLAGILSIDNVLLHAEERSGKSSGISYHNVVDAAKTILIGRKKDHKHEPAELLAVAHN
jgi:CBS domain-containing protein